MGHTIIPTHSNRPPTTEQLRAFRCHRALLAGTWASLWTRSRAHAHCLWHGYSRHPGKDSPNDRGFDSWYAPLQGPGRSCSRDVCHTDLRRPQGAFPRSHVESVYKDDRTDRTQGDTAKAIFLAATFLSRVIDCHSAPSSENSLTERAAPAHLGTHKRLRFQI